MVEPVSRVQSYNAQKVGSASSKSSGQSDVPFNMDQALAEESARDEGVYYEHGKAPQAKSSGQQKSEASAKQDEPIIEKPNPDAPLGAIDTGNLIKGIGRFLSGLWDKLLKIFGNFWESKPLTEGVKDETADMTDDPLHTEDSMNFHYSTIGQDTSSIPQDEFDAAIDELEKESDKMSDTVPEDHIKPYEDKAIKDALMSGDDERFERLITRGGERHAAISSTLLTQYDSKGRIIQIDPSDENLILHGKNRTSRDR
jgi:hypothetical protein